MDYTIKNLREVDDIAAAQGFGEVQEVRFAHGDLGAEQSGVSLQRVQMTFTDTVGLTAPQVTLPAPVLTRQFGSTLVEARSQRTFPFTFPFGCNTSRTGTLVVVVTVNDDHGRDTTTEARVPVR